MHCPTWMMGSLKPGASGVQCARMCCRSTCDTAAGGIIMVDAEARSAGEVHVRLTVVEWQQNVSTSGQRNASQLTRRASWRTPNSSCVLSPICISPVQTPGRPAAACSAFVACAMSAGLPPTAARS